MLRVYSGQPAIEPSHTVEIKKIVALHVALRDEVQLFKFLPKGLFVLEGVLQDEVQLF
jgi:hypothetical protein